MPATFLASTLDAGGDPAAHGAARRAARTSSSTWRRSGWRSPASAALLRDIDVPAAGGRRGALHQRMGPRLPPGVPADRRAAGATCRAPRVLACTATATPDRARRDPARGSACPPTRRSWSAASRAPTWCCARARGADRRERDAHVDALLARGARRAAGDGSARHGDRLRADPQALAEEEADAPARARGWRAAAYHAGLSAERDARRVQGAFRDGERWSGGGHQRLRHGHRPPGRARGRPSGAARARSRPTTRRSAAPAATARRRCGLLLGLAGRHRRCAGGCSRRNGGDAQSDAVVEHKWGHVPRADALGRGRQLPPRRDPALLRRRGGDAPTAAATATSAWRSSTTRPARSRGGHADRAQGAERGGARARPLRHGGRGAPAARHRRSTGSRARASTGRRTFGALKEHAGGVDPEAAAALRHRGLGGLHRPAIGRCCC